jgi:hypothetical protein
MSLLSCQDVHLGTQGDHKLPLRPRASHHMLQLSLEYDDGAVLGYDYLKRDATQTIEAQMFLFSKLFRRTVHFRKHGSAESPGAIPSRTFPLAFYSHAEKKNLSRIQTAFVPFAQSLCSFKTYWRGRGPRRGPHRLIHECPLHDFRANTSTLSICGAVESFHAGSVINDPRSRSIVFRYCKLDQILPAASRNHFCSTSTVHSCRRCVRPSHSFLLRTSRFRRDESSRSRTCGIGGGLVWAVLWGPGQINLLDFSC